jgi:hypothetical protein
MDEVLRNVDSVAGVLIRGRAEGAHACCGFASGCSLKNAYLRLVASMLRLVGLTSHAGICMSPTHWWPGPLTVLTITVASLAQVV